MGRRRPTRTAHMPVAAQAEPSPISLNLDAFSDFEAAALAVNTTVVRSLDLVFSNTLQLSDYAALAIPLFPDLFPPVFTRRAILALHRLAAAHNSADQVQHRLGGANPYDQIGPHRARSRGGSWCSRRMNTRCRRDIGSIHMGTACSLFVWVCSQECEHGTQRVRAPQALECVNYKFRKPCHDFKPSVLWDLSASKPSWGAYGSVSR
jgi:hypothetical protein